MRVALLDRVFVKMTRDDWGRHSSVLSMARFYEKDGWWPSYLTWTYKY